MTPDQWKVTKEYALIMWTQHQKKRDELIIDAIEAGITKHRIHIITGIARSTIDRIVDQWDAYRELQEKRRRGIGA